MERANPFARLIGLHDNAQEENRQHTAEHEVVEFVARVRVIAEDDAGPERHRFQHRRKGERVPPPAVRRADSARCGVGVCPSIVGAFDVVSPLVQLLMSHVWHNCEIRKFNTIFLHGLTMSVRRRKRLHRVHTGILRQGNAGVPAA